MATSDPARILARLGARPRKGLGQHFLVDARVAARQIDHARVTRDDVAMEIGPGLGVLTRGLVARARKVVAIEADRILAAYLRDEIPEAEIVHGDALEVEWPPLDVMASNLPYPISSPLPFRPPAPPFARAVVGEVWEFVGVNVEVAAPLVFARLSVGVYRRAK